MKAVCNSSHIKCGSTISAKVSGTYRISKVKQLLEHIMQLQDIYERRDMSWFGSFDSFIDEYHGIIISSCQQGSPFQLCDIETNDEYEICR